MSGNASKVILSICDFSGNWSRPYKELGYDVRQIDIKLGQDARLLKKLKEPVWGILCAPLCTAFSSAGARHWAAKEAEGNSQLLEGLALVDACIRIVVAHKPKWWCLEQPVGRLKDWLGWYHHAFHPYEYAGWLTPEQGRADEQYSKKTCLFGRFVIPEKREMPNTLGSKMWSTLGGKSERTKTLRSITPMGFSRAFCASNR